MPWTASDFHVTNATDLDIDKLNQALTYLNGSATANAVLSVAYLKDTTINIVHDGKDTYTSGTVNTINWDPDKGLLIRNTADDGQPSGAESAALGLAHEATHAADPNFDAETHEPNSQYDNEAEAYAIDKTNTMARTLGEPTRDNHGGTPIPVTNSTEHTTPDGDHIDWVERGRDGTQKTEGTYTKGTAPTTAPETNQGGDTGYTGYTGDSGGSWWGGSGWGSGAGSGGSCSDCAGGCSSCACSSCGCASCGSCGSCGSCSACSSCMC